MHICVRIYSKMLKNTHIRISHKLLIESDKLYRKALPLYHNREVQQMDAGIWGVSSKKKSLLNRAEVVTSPTEMW